MNRRTFLSCHSMCRYEQMRRMITINHRSIHTSISIVIISKVCIELRQLTGFKLQDKRSEAYIGRHILWGNVPITINKRQMMYNTFYGEPLSPIPVQWTWNTFFLMRTSCFDLVYYLTVIDNILIISALALTCINTNLFQCYDLSFLHHDLVAIMSWSLFSNCFMYSGYITELSFILYHVSVYSVLSCFLFSICSLFLFLLTPFPL